VTEEDLPIFFVHQRDPDATRMAAFPPRERPSFMAHWTSILGDESVVAKTVVVAERVAGNVVSFERLGLREVGYWIGREHWGRGVATDAVAQFVREVKARPLYARVAAHNVASIRVLEKCGFVPDEEAGRSHPLDDSVNEVVLKLEA
jgi:RimJ/RimL family protein N-acetyltransferase